MPGLKGLLLLVVYVKYAQSLFDPISISVGLGIAAGLGYKFDYFCRFSECCNADFIMADTEKLEREMKSNLFGQHIVIQQLVPAIRAHFSGVRKPKKPLVLSFHGTQGTGKNYVAEFIAKSLYKKGLESKFVHLYKGRGDFPLQSEIEKYKERIHKEITEGIAACPRSLFIFDEVDKMPPGIFESLTSLVDYGFPIKGVDHSFAVFVLLSNTAGVQIARRLGELMSRGVLRERTKLSEFERVIETAAYNLENGMKKSSLVTSFVVDHYIPFLPMEKSHVYHCIEAEFKRWGVTPQPEVVNTIIEENIVFDEDSRLFATSGCKTLGPKVAVEVHLMEIRKREEIMLT